MKQFTILQMTKNTSYMSLENNEQKNTIKQYLKK